MLNELLPAVRKLKTRDGRAINLYPTATIMPQPAAAPVALVLALAWRRPDQLPASTP